MTHARSARANILLATSVKLISMAVALLSVPLLLKILGTESYGIWATLTSLVAFINLLDLGVGNSVRNSVASMDAASTVAVQSEFVAFFQLLSCIGILSLGIFAAVLYTTDLAARHHTAAWLLYGPLLMLLPLLLGANVLQGARATGLQSTLQAFGNWIFLAWVACQAWTSYAPSLELLAAVWSGLYALSLGAIFLFALWQLKLPLSGLLRWTLSELPRDRLKVGIEFLALQLSSLVLYGLGNALILHHLSASEVARYDVLNRIFQVGLSFYTIVIGVLWSEIARYRAVNDGQALRRIHRRLAAIAGSFAACCFCVALAAPWIVQHWTGGRVHVTTSEALAAASLAAIQAIAYVGGVFLNAFEQIRVQVILAVVSIALMIPTASVLMSLSLGIASVPLAAALFTLLPALICNVQALTLIRGAEAAAGSHLKPHQHGVHHG